MTQAFNLAQLANNLNTSGQLDATDGLTGLVTNANLASSGTASSSTYLRGDRTWATLPASGKLLQVVQGVFTGSVSTSSTSFVDVTGFQATITPSSTSSKVLLMVTTSILHETSAYSQGEIRVLRNGSDPASIPSGRAWTSDCYLGSATVADVATTYLDSPASTSALTYKLQFRTRHGNSVNIGRDWNAELYGVHSITLMEIGA